jgi:hypothetical protein
MLDFSQNEDEKSSQRQEYQKIIKIKAISVNAYFLF